MTRARSALLLLLHNRRQTNPGQPSRSATAFVGFGEHPYQSWINASEHPPQMRRAD